jgi:hypothetical protein
MESQLTIQALWEDDGLLTIDSQVASWGFVGKTQVYTSYEALEEWAKELAALPLMAGQAVDFQAGERNSYAYLGVRISVLDSVGHCQCRVEFESNSVHTWESKNKLEVEILVEPNAVDRFITGLTAIAQTKNRGEACLLSVNSLTPT